MSLWSLWSLWKNLNSSTDGTFSFLNNLHSDQNDKIIFLLRGLPFPFEVEASIMIKRVLSSAVGEIYKIRTDEVCELEAPWLA